MSHPNSPITYHWLESSNAADAHRLDQIEDTITSLGWTPLPSRSTYGATHRILVAVNNINDQLVGWHVVQFFTHAEPIYVQPGYRGTGIAADLAAQVFDMLVTSSTRGFIVVADNPVAVQLCERYGLKRIEKPVYSYGG